MTKFWQDVVLPIREKLIAILKAQASANNVEVGEIIAGIHGSPLRYQRTGIYVLVPSSPDPKLLTTVSGQATLRFPIDCNLAAWTEAQHLDQLGEMEGVVVDALAANPTLAGLLGVSEAWVSLLGPIEVEFGGGPVPHVATQTHIVSVLVEWNVNQV